MVRESTLRIQTMRDFKALKHVFRKYDIRGVYPEEINEGFAYRLAVAFGKILEDMGANTVVVGGDVRTHTPSIKDSFVRGLTHMGMTILDIGTVPTPVMYFAAKSMNVHAGVQVTASHNPPEFNGFKIVLGGDPFYGDDIQRLYSIFSDPHLSPRYPYPNGKVIPHDALSDYVSWVSKNVSVSGKFHVGVDDGNGVAGPVVEMLYPKKGIEYEGLYMKPDGTFPNHIPDPTVPKYMEDLSRLVVERGLDMGFGFD